MTLILSLDDVKSVLTMKDCIDAVEEAFRQLSLGNVVQPTRPTIRVPAHRALINAMPAYIGGVEALGRDRAVRLPEVVRARAREQDVDVPRLGFDDAVEAVEVLEIP